MAVGRPRTTVPQPKEVIKLGKELVAWAKEEKTGEIRGRFCEWYAIEKGMIRKQWERLCDTPEFRVYYEQARAILGRRFYDGTINPSVAHRFMWHYIPEAKEQELERIRESAKAKALEDVSAGVTLDQLRKEWGEKNLPSKEQSK